MCSRRCSRSWRSSRHWPPSQALSYPQTFASIGLYLSLYAAGAHQARFRRGLVAVPTAGYAVLVLVLHSLGSPDRAQDFLVFYLALAVTWLAGAGMRRWRAEEAELRRLSADVATAAERARIARELHDVVTHHVIAMVVRHLLGVLEATGDSAVAHRTPTLGRIGDLVEQARLSGQPVELTEHGDQRPQAVDVELAAYRVVQEALTNAIKHATGRPTTITSRSR
ncbi:MAG TPA: histidine kinase [Nonomuraea sp.]|nr:histidine kinase [Nonomuraea sp.]